MAKYNITYACGHEGIVNLVGKIKERERYIEWASSNKLCPECYRAKVEKERAEENRRAQAEAEADGLPPLVGTPKQVAWATTIRQRIINFMKEKHGEHLRTFQVEIMEGVRCAAKERGVAAEKLKNADAMLGWHKIEDLEADINSFVQSLTDAKFWIENQDHSDIASLFADRCVEKLMDEVAKPKNLKTRT